MEKLKCAIYFLSKASIRPYNCQLCLLVGLFCPLFQGGTVKLTTPCSDQFHCLQNSDSVEMRLGMFKLSDWTSTLHKWLCGNYFQKVVSDVHIKQINESPFLFLTLLVAGGCSTSPYRKSALRPSKWPPNTPKFRDFSYFHMTHEVNIQELTEFFG